MGLILHELDQLTREFMLREFDAEQMDPLRYVPKVLSSIGRERWPLLLRAAIQSGNDDTLEEALSAQPDSLNSTESYVRNGIVRRRTLNPRQASERLAKSEFNTWYVRGLSARLLSERVDEVKVYRAGFPKWEPGDCATHEGLVVPVRVVYDGHRSRYWPTEDLSAFAVPFQPGCHHSVMRVELN